MTHRDYQTEHDACSHDLAQAESKFEGLRKTYDAADSEEKSRLAPELKEATENLEAARDRLHSLETANPQHETERLQGFATDEAPARTTGGAEKTEILRDGLELFEDLKKYSDTLNEFARVAVTAAATVFASPNDHGLEHAFMTSAPSVESLQPLPDQNRDFHDFDADFASLARGPQEIREEREQSDAEMRSANRDVNDAFLDAPSRSAADLPAQNAKAQEFEQQAAAYDDAVTRGITARGDYAAAVAQAQEGLYSSITGSRYEGAADGLTTALSAAIETAYGAGFRESFAASRPEMSSDREVQLGHSPEETPGRRY